MQTMEIVPFFALRCMATRAVWMRGYSSHGAVIEVVIVEVGLAVKSRKPPVDSQNILGAAFTLISALVLEVGARTLGYSLSTFVSGP